LLWLFSDQLAIMFLYIPGQNISDLVLFGRAKVILVAILSILFALVSYVLVLKYSLMTVHRPPPPVIPQEAFSDLMLSREQFRKLYENSPVPYFSIDSVGNIRNPNTAALRFLGGTLEECISTNFYSLLIDEGDSSQGMSLLKAKVERSVPISQEEMRITTINRKKDRYALVSIYSLAHNSSVAFRHLVTLVDVSKERENEQVKTDFLLLASHQLRTPLTTIKWHIDYLLSSDSIEMPDLVREYLEQIYIGNERMIELITTLLTVSRIEMGVLAPQYEEVEVNKVVQDILAELSADIKKRKTEVVVTTEGDDVLTTDYTMLRIIIHNLLTNAIKYTSNGGKVTIESMFSPHSCTIAVSDTGYGIPIDEQEKIFTKMFRATNARKVSANGTGLGLYMSRAFTEKLGGSMTFYSEEEKGTTFTITLPRVAPEA